MANYISSVCVVLAPKDPELSFKSVDLTLDSCVGYALPCAVSYILKNPIVKFYLKDYFITSLNFKYTRL